MLPMRTKVLAKKIGRREFISVMFLISIYVFCYYIPIFAEVAINNNVFLPKAEKEKTVPHQGEWDTIESAYFTIYCRPEANLKAIREKLRRRRFYIGRGLKPKPSSSPQEKIAYRIDLIFNRARDILDKRPRNMDDKIKIFKDRSELNDEYYSIFGQRKNFKSFYIHKYETIYTNESDISDSVMAHEMGHAIVDHYFVVSPPEKIKEMLSSYVDMHLEE